MTQGRKRMVIVVVVLALLFAAVWGYLTYTGRQSEDLGYLVRRDGCGIENVLEYVPEHRAGYAGKSEKKNGTESGFRELAMSEMKYEQEGKNCHG